MLEYTRLKNNTQKDFSGLMKIKVAMLCDSASQLLNTALRGYGYDRGINFEVFEADYDQIERQVFDNSSELYSFAPEYIIISKSPHKLLSKFYATHADERAGFAEKTIQQTDALVTSIENNIGAKVIFLNFQELNDSVFGNYANKVEISFLYQVRKINLILMDEARRHKNLFICDVQMLTAHHGIHTAVNNKQLISADLIWSLDFIPVIAKNITSIISAITGTFKKCVILDLDNTTWGGVIGDDGMEGIQIGDLGIGKAFTQLQKWVKELKHRGIIVCVCSKNSEEVAKEVFEKHPDMVLRIEDISVFVANWENKVDNIHFIKNTLNIGFDSMVFLDDNSFERNMVRSAIPEIEVPELPADPVDYLPFLKSLNLFETSSFTADDSKRTQQYQEEAKRNTLQQVYKNEKDFLEHLNMVAEISFLNPFNIPRAAQLSQRSNQYNLRTVRYTEEDLGKIAADEKSHAFVVKLKDDFGDYGIISFIILKEKSDKELFIDTWLMSCRVLKRTVEHFVLNKMLEIASANGDATLTGEYIPTPKNGLVKDHYEKLGFANAGNNTWTMDVNTAALPVSYINEMANEKHN